MTAERPTTRRGRATARRLRGIGVAGMIAASAVIGVPVSNASATPGSVQVLQLHNAGEARLREVWVYRPATAETTNLPVLYFLHGVPGNASDVFTAGGLAQSMDAYVRAGGTPFVVVAADGNGAQHADSEWADAADGSDRIESFLIHVVMPAVEGSHPRDAAHRAIAGFSMGGYGAMNLALRHRQLFGQVVSIAGYFHVDDPSHMFSRQPATIASNSPDRHVAAARGLRIMLADGLADTETVVEGESTRFAGLLRHAGIPVTLSLTPGTHGWDFAKSQLPAMEHFVAEGWTDGATRRGSTPSRRSAHRERRDSVLGSDQHSIASQDR